MENIQKNMGSPFSSAFNFVDKDHDSKINILELKAALEKLEMNPSDTELQEVIKKYGDSSSETINYAGFQKHIDEILSKFVLVDNFGGDLTVEQYIMAVFDKQGTGLMSFEQLQIALALASNNMAEVKVKDLLKKYDGNTDGLLTYEEFQTLLKTECGGKNLDYLIWGWPKDE